jgi:hypothetical protein
MRMLTVYCGDNTIESRNKFLHHKKLLHEQGYECLTVAPDEIHNIDVYIHGSASLFSEKRAFFSENVLARKQARDALKSYIDDAETQMIIWERSMDDRDIKKYLPKVLMKSSKLPINVWKLLDSLYPGNARNAIAMLREVVEVADENMLHYMIQRRIKDLILIQAGMHGKRSFAPWQISTLKAQAVRWGNGNVSREKLDRMSAKLFDIELGVKTGELSYPIHKALDILFSFYLQ